jgi:hypothetical protein
VSTFAFYYPFEVLGKGVAAGIPMEAQFDALLYLGPTKSITYSRLSREQCADVGYLAMRTRRVVVLGDDTSAAGGGPNVRRYCASLGR